MLQIKTYHNNFYPNRQNLHVQIPKRYHFPDDCLILTMVTKPAYVLFHDNGEIFKSISQERSQINPPIYRHGLNRYALSHGNNLQIIDGGTDLGNVLFTKHLSRDQLTSAVKDFVRFIQKINQAGMHFKYVY